MVSLRAANFFDALEFSQSRAFLRKALVYQVRNSEAFVVERDGARLALGMFWAWRARRVEFSLVVAPPGQSNMVAMVRLAHLTICQVVQKGILVFARIRASDLRAQRMARLVGFVPSKLADPEIWIFRG